MGYVFEEELLMLLPGLVSGIPTGLFGIAAYILTSLAIYTVSRRRGLKNAWLAWVPVINCWLLGSLSDQYQYVVKGENKSKRKWLMILNILKAEKYSIRPLRSWYLNETATLHSPNATLTFVYSAESGSI